MVRVGGSEPPTKHFTHGSILHKSRQRTAIPTSSGCHTHGRGSIHLVEHLFARGIKHKLHQSLPSRAAALEAPAQRICRSRAIGIEHDVHCVTVINFVLTRCIRTSHHSHTNGIGAPQNSGADLPKRLKARHNSCHLPTAAPSVTAPKALARKSSKPGPKHVCKTPCRLAQSLAAKCQQAGQPADQMRRLFTRSVHQHVAFQRGCESCYVDLLLRCTPLYVRTLRPLDVLGLPGCSTATCAAAGPLSADSSTSAVGSLA